MEKNAQSSNAVVALADVESTEVDNPMKRFRESPTSTAEPRQSSHTLACVGGGDSDAQSVSSMVKPAEPSDPDEMFLEPKDTPAMASIQSNDLFTGNCEDNLPNEFVKWDKIKSTEKSINSDELIESGDEVSVVKNIEKSTNENKKETDLPADKKSLESRIKSPLKEFGMIRLLKEPSDSTWKNVVELSDDENDQISTMSIGASEDLLAEKTIDLTADDDDIILNIKNAELKTLNKNEDPVTMNQPFCDSLKNTVEKCKMSANGNDQISISSLIASEDIIPEETIDLTDDDDTNLNIENVELKHPSPLPETHFQNNLFLWKSLPPAPTLTVLTQNSLGVKFLVTMNTALKISDIKLFEVYFYEEHPSIPSNKKMWKNLRKFDFVCLPFKFELTRLTMERKNPKIHVKVRAVDEHNRKGPFSEPISLMLD